MADTSLERVESPEDHALIASIVGRTIAAADLRDGESGPCYLTLTFDDGTQINISGWGHDWWGLNIERLA